MKRISLSWYAPIIAAALLAACGGSQPPIGAPGVVPKNVANATQPDADASSTTEFLYARHVKETCGGTSYGCNCVFHADGKAAGPFPGTFTARGSWNATRNERWKFSEVFSIKSLGNVIPGSISGQGVHPEMKGGCVRFGPHVMTWFVGSKTGKVRVRFRWDHTMLEHLQKLTQ